MATYNRTFRELCLDLRTELVNDIEFYTEAYQRAERKEDKIRFNAKLEHCEQMYDYMVWLVHRKDKAPWEE